jgi:alkylation response protein AidB-like acyl-CoA dehydrogenase
VIDLLDEGLRALRERARAFAAEAIAPLAAREEHEADEEGSVRECLRRLAQAGWLREVVPQEHGGARPRVSLRALCILREELAFASGLADVAFAMQGLGSFAVTLAGSEALRRRWLPAVASGRAIAAIAITEPQAGSDIAATATTARRDGDDYVLDGEKTLISNAGIADFYALLARTGPGEGSRGLSLFLVEGDRPGLSVPRRIPLIAPHPIGDLALSGCRVPAANRVGEEGEGFRIAMRTLDAFRPSVGAAAVGFARRALEEALGRARSVRRFGRPIGEFGAVRAALAESAVELEAARLLVLRAAALWDEEKSEDVTFASASAKLFATEAAQRGVDRAVQIHGGTGVVRGIPVERLYREVRALRLYEGTSEILREVIARGLLGERDRSPRA